MDLIMSPLRRFPLTIANCYNHYTPARPVRGGIIFTKTNSVKGNPAIYFQRLQLYKLLQNIFIIFLCTDKINSCIELADIKFLDICMDDFLHNYFAIEINNK
jgi:hypothetical protein